MNTKDRFGGAFRFLIEPVQEQGLAEKASQPIATPSVDEENVGHDDERSRHVSNRLKLAGVRRNAVLTAARNPMQLTGDALAAFQSATTGDAPKCFTKPQWDAWRAMARFSKPRPIDGYCEDCTPEYQREMIAEGRCAFPQTRFMDDEGYRIFMVRAPRSARKAAKA